MSSLINVDADQLPITLTNLSVQDQVEVQIAEGINGKCCENHVGVCAICLDKIVLQETALVKGCQHAYCVMCILRWATYSQKPTCPQCKHPFESLNVHGELDGSIRDYMFEESVCLLLKAAWFKPLIVEDHEDAFDDLDDYCPYEYENDKDDEDDLIDVYFRHSNLRIGNRRWGDNGYIRSGHQEARPVYQPNIQDGGAGSSHEPEKKEIAEDRTGRRAKRTLKREAADKAAAAKDQQHLARLRRK